MKKIPLEAVQLRADINLPGITGKHEHNLKGPDFVFALLPELGAVEIVYGALTYWVPFTECRRVVPGAQMEADGPVLPRSRKPAPPSGGAA